MILKPIPLLFLIVITFSLMCVSIGGCHEPTSACGFTFWISFGVFAFCCIHLAKNEDYYKNYIDE